MFSWTIRSPELIFHIHMVFPIRHSTVRYGTGTGTCTVPSPNPDTVQYSTIPSVIDPITVRTDSVPHGTILGPEIVPLTVPFTFLQGLKMPRRIDSHSKNKYTKIRKNSRTPLFVPRIIEHSKDADPHLDQSKIL